MPSKNLTIPRSSEKTIAPLAEDNTQRTHPPKVGFISLGCPKNLVDSEVMMGLLARAGAELSPRAEDADVIVVNTCSFIESAQQESVNTILEMAGAQVLGARQKLVVAGCLVERFRDEIRNSIPEVDAVVGTGELENILAATGVAPAPASKELAFRGAAFASRGRRTGGAGPILSRAMGRRHRGSPQLSLRRPHTAYARHAQLHGIYKDRRGLRSSLHVLHHSPASRPVSLATI